MLIFTLKQVFTQYLGQRSRSLAFELVVSAMAEAKGSPGSRVARLRIHWPPSVTEAKQLSYGVCYLLACSGMVEGRKGILTAYGCEFLFEVPEGTRSLSSRRLLLGIGQLNKFGYFACPRVRQLHLEQAAYLIGERLTILKFLAHHFPNPSPIPDGYPWWTDATAYRKGT
ncbi:MULTISPECIES: hypothetical protein [unclassified Frankia]|uniref:hypothetical protein n=1 Tax=unclassified Frankia TaxID=2632575 RepID=UPI00054E0FE9|nr:MULTISPECIES: hypothetical protein [unclassified Frankia]OHV48517.1 hypothetical protein CgIS1_05770 [Frankia sp. CgIS1]